MSGKQNANPGSSSQSQDNKNKISEHTKSVDISSSKKRSWQAVQIKISITQAASTMTGMTQPAIRMLAARNNFK